jgi:hypothetical protein
MPPQADDGLQRNITGKCAAASEAMAVRIMAEATNEGGFVGRLGPEMIRP